MRSDKEQLEKRGFLPEEFDTDSYDLSFIEKLGLLKSNIQQIEPLLPDC